MQGRPGPLEEGLQCAAQNIHFQSFSQVYSKGAIGFPRVTVLWTTGNNQTFQGLLGTSSELALTPGAQNITAVPQSEWGLWTSEAQWVLAQVHLTVVLWVPEPILQLFPPF